MTYRTSSASLETTDDIAAQMGMKLRGGEVIALTSDLGGGKTAFVRGLARGMGSSDHVASPTFTIGRQYQAARAGLTLYHFDFYRLQEAGLMSLELAEAVADPAAIIAVEWGDIVDNVLPAEKLVITLTRTGEDSRDLTFAYPASLSYLITDGANAAGQAAA